MKRAYELKLHREWRLTIDSEKELEQNDQVFTDAINEMLNTNLADLVEVEYWGPAEVYPFWEPDTEVVIDE